MEPENKTGISRIEPDGVGSQAYQRLTWNVKEAAKLLGISRNNAYELCKTGKLPHLTLGLRRILIPKAALEKMLADASKEKEDTNNDPAK